MIANSDNVNYRFQDSLKLRSTKIAEEPTLIATRLRLTDIDELDDLEPGFGSGRYLTPEEFFELADKERYHQEVAKAQKKLNTLTYKPDILLHEEYLPANLWSKLPDTGILNIKARKGGGKSAVIKGLILLALVLQILLQKCYNSK